jgi:hypothetical protein
MDRHEGESMTQTILAPVMALVLWSLVMWAWLYVTRIPAMRKARIKLDPDVPSGTLTQSLPPQVRWKADNYNHLMEQPTLFYATALALAVAGSGGGLNLQLAWAYVGLRIAHSLVQALINVILLRWALFMASSLVLVVLAVRAAMRVF